MRFHRFTKLLSIVWVPVFACPEWSNSNELACVVVTLFVIEFPRPPLPVAAPMLATPLYTIAPIEALNELDKVTTTFAVVTGGLIIVKTPLVKIEP
jgi:hypothetical protein